MRLRKYIEDRGMKSKDVRVFARRFCLLSFGIFVACWRID